MRLRWLLVPLVGVLILSACGISSPKTKSSSTATSKRTVASTIPWLWPPHVLSAGTDNALATNTSLLLTDMPEGWSDDSNAATITPNNNNLDEAFVQCMFGSAPTLLSGYAVSPLIKSSDANTLAQSFVRVTTSITSSRSDFASFKAARAAQCQSAMYTRQISLSGTGTVIGKKFGTAAPDAIPSDTLTSPDGSKDVIGIRMFIAPRDSSTTFLDMFAFGAGRFETVLIFQSTKTNPDDTAEIAAITAVKNRTLANEKTLR